MMRYTRLRGLPVVAADGRRIGRVADLIVRQRGDEAVVGQLLVAANDILLFAARLGRDIATIAVEAGDVASLDDREVRLGRPSRSYAG